MTCLVAHSLQFLRRQIPLVIFFLSVAASLPLTSAPAFARSDDFVSFNECESHTLRLVLNVDNASSKRDLLKALKIFAQYPSITFTPVPVKGAQAAFLASSLVCENESSANKLGWRDLQWRLKKIGGLAISCEPLNTKENETETCPGQSKEQGPCAPNAAHDENRRVGGVTGSN